MWFQLGPSPIGQNQSNQTWLGISFCLQKKFSGGNYVFLSFPCFRQYFIETRSSFICAITARSAMKPPQKVISCRKPGMMGHACIIPPRPVPLAGKLLQCRCGGDDASTQFLCDQQPVTTWDIFIYPHNSTYSWDSGTALGRVSERAGTYSAVSAGSRHAGALH